MKYNKTNLLTRTREIRMLEKFRSSLTLSKINQTYYIKFYSFKIDSIVSSHLGLVFLPKPTSIENGIILPSLVLITEAIVGYPK